MIKWSCCVFDEVAHSLLRGVGKLTLKRWWTSLVLWYLSCAHLTTRCWVSHYIILHVCNIKYMGKIAFFLCSLLFIELFVYFLWWLHPQKMRKKLESCSDIFPPIFFFLWDFWGCGFCVIWLLYLFYMSCSFSPIKLSKHW